MKNIIKLFRDTVLTQGNMDFYNSLLIWFVFWVITYGVLSFLRKLGINYVNRYGWLILTFLVPAIVAVYVFKDLISKRLESSIIVPFLILLTFFVLSISVYYFSNRYLTKPTNLIKNHPNEFFLRMNYRYLFSKSFDILFQQIMVFILTLLLLENNLKLFEIIVLFVFLFGGVHLFQYAYSGKFFSTYYLFFSVVSAGVFPILIIKANYEFIYSYVIHWLFYIVSGVIFWLPGRKFT